jgi:hypothetical protein
MNVQALAAFGSSTGAKSQLRSSWRRAGHLSEMAFSSLLFSSVVQTPHPIITKMKTLVAAGPTDDASFVEVLNSLLQGLISQHKPEALWIIQIDNWFDHKWLKFSGMGGVASPFLLGGLVTPFDSVKVEFYQGKLTFPPFTPNRVLGQWSYSRIGDDYREVPFPAMPHSSKRQRSPMNLQRRIQGLSRSACFVWYSANTIANGRGSVMVYDLRADGLECWFAAFNRLQGWKVQQTKGVSRDDVEQLVAMRSS